MRPIDRLSALVALLLVLALAGISGCPEWQIAELLESFGGKRDMTLDASTPPEPTATVPQPTSSHRAVISSEGGASHDATPERNEP